MALSCDKSTPPEPERTTQSTPGTSANAATGNLRWQDPAGWTREQNPSPMRKATYRVPRAEGDVEDGELGVFFFAPGLGGSVDANLKRWIGQFEGTPEVKRGSRSVHGMLQHSVEIARGTYAGGMPGMPKSSAPAKPDHALLGAIVETPNGNYFFKLTGPASTVAAARSQFFELLDGVEFK